MKELGQLIETAVGHYDVGDFETAKEYLLKAYSEDSKNIDVLNFLGLTSLHLDEIEKAHEYFKEALKIDSNDALILNNIGYAYSLEEDYDNAKKYYTDALNKKPEYSAAHYNLGVVQMEKGEIEAAHNSFDKAIEFAEDDDVVDPVYEKAFLYVEEDDYQKSYDLLIKYDKFEDPELLNLKAICLDQLGKTEEAIKVYEFVESRSENDELTADIYFNKALALVKLNDNDKAIAALEEAVAIYEDIKGDIADTEEFEVLRGNAKFDSLLK
jgi:tetratricopeptide (TPR) repeat protein